MNLFMSHKVYFYLAMALVDGFHPNNGAKVPASFEGDFVSEAERCAWFYFILHGIQHGWVSTHNEDGEAAYFAFQAPPDVENLPTDGIFKLPFETEAEPFDI